MGKIRNVISPDADEVARLRIALNTKETTEPLLKELRALFSRQVPTWASTITEDSDLTPQKLTAVAAALQDRIANIAALPQAPMRDEALARHHAAMEDIARMYQQLTGDDLSLNDLPGTLSELDDGPTGLADALEALTVSPNGHRS